MKNTMITLAALLLFAAATAQATLTVYPIAEKGNTSYSFSLKGEDRGYAIENIDAREGEFYIRLCYDYTVVTKGYKMAADKKGKTFTGGNSSEAFTFSAKKGSWKYSANNVNSSFTLGYFGSNGNPSYDNLFDTKGKASAKGVVDEDVIPTFEEGKKFFGLFCDTTEPAMLIHAQATGKAGKSWKYSDTLEDGSKVKFSMKISKKGDTAAVSMSFKTSKYVHPAFITEP